MSERYGFGCETAADLGAETRYDVVVIGGGAAGLHVALSAAEIGGRVCLVARKPLAESSSYWAQGGLAAALADDDSPQLHAEDTLTAGRAACRRGAVEVLSAEAPAAVHQLEARGVEFDRDPDGRLALGLEGGHSKRRVVHAGGAETGRRITARLAQLAAEHPSIEVLEETSAEALWSDGERCAGAVTSQGPLLAGATVLATGGAAALWRRTTNPWGSVGAGAVIAAAAGATLADLEFCQFHPTALAAPDHPRDGMLVTEAVRGEGALLLDATGRRFTDELAPRDAVTAAVLERMRVDGTDSVRLDMRELDEGRFPNVFSDLRAAGFDPLSELVPVAPAAHYAMGGVATDLDGRSSLPGLLAVGECACTGLHGANRLASNSLSECFVFGSRAAAAALEAAAGGGDPPPQPSWRFDPPGVSTREAMWEGAGPIRDAAGLEPLLDDPYPLARAIAALALAREESRGAHFRSDFPQPDHDLDHVHLTWRFDDGVGRERWG